MKIIKNKQEALELIKEEPSILVLCSDKLKNDKNFVLAAVRQDGYALEYASEELRTAITGYQKLNNLK